MAHLWEDVSDPEPPAGPVAGREPEDDHLWEDVSDRDPVDSNSDSDGEYSPSAAEVNSW